jgi:3-deoxy-manno-octulosonate cytidylyltransferase (CMP-KDO synthetase)
MPALVLIPARLGSTRLPGKPLADIAGEPMIVHVLKRALDADVGPVVVATDSEAIVAAVQKSGGQAILTRPDHVSGSDRIFEALEQIDPDRAYDRIVNVQGDLPRIERASIKAAVRLLDNPKVDIGTLGAAITSEKEWRDPNVVKAITQGGGNRRRAIDFQRILPGPFSGEGIHHIGLYAYQRSALEKFVHLSPSRNEKERRLEQMRALDHGMQIDIALVDEVPLGVDTEHDLERARDILKARPL